jgi:hypothetical protein
MRRYRYEDHSMLAAMMAVDDIMAGRTDITSPREVKTERDYHEGKRSTECREPAGYSPELMGNSD